MQKKPKAFSLIELSIVITIIAILVVGAVSVSIFNDTKEKIKLTQERMNEIYKALGIYAAKNGKLPCPASMKVESSDASYGFAADCSYTCTSTSFPSSSLGIWCSSAATNIWYGMIPVSTLDLPISYATDAFGTRFSYFVLRGYTNTTDFASENTSTFINGSANYSYDSGDSEGVGAARIRVYENLNGINRRITDNAAFVIVSHGPNKFGGWNDTATTQNAESSVSNFERANYITPSTTDATNIGMATFYSSYITAKHDTSKVFDDIVLYKTIDQLVLDFNILYLVPCDKPDGSGNSLYPLNKLNIYDQYGSSTSSWPSGNTAPKYGAIYNSTSTCSSPYNKWVTYPNRRCGAFGIWETTTTENCFN